LTVVPRFHLAPDWAAPLPVGTAPQASSFVGQSRPIIPGVFGSGGIAGEAGWIAKSLLHVFVSLFVVSLIMVRNG
jgi:uncharacterized membrane protein YtjA (UPF0391 family)